MLNHLSRADLARLAAELPAVDEDHRLVAAGSYLARDQLAQGNPAQALATVYTLACAAEDSHELMETLLAEIGASWNHIEALKGHIDELHRLLRSYDDLPAEVQNFIDHHRPHTGAGAV